MLKLENNGSSESSADRGEWRREKREQGNFELKLKSKLTFILIKEVRKIKKKNYENEIYSRETPLSL